MEGLKKVFADWRPKFFLGSSIISQILLVIWSYGGTRNSSRPPILRIFWLVVHSAADYFAALSLTTIFHVYMETKGEEGFSDKYYLAFWASFSLLHRGRQGRIIAFSLEDNEFWPKQAATIILDWLTTICILILSPIKFPKIWPPLIIFIVATLKLGERIWALNYGSIKRLNSTLEKPKPGSDIHEVVSEQNEGERGGEILLPLPDQDNVASNIHQPDDSSEPEDPQTIHSSVSEVIFLCEAYHSFNKYKGMYADVRFTSLSRNIRRNPSVLSIRTELDFAHDLFYGKSIKTHTFIGFLFRLIITIPLIIVAAVLFSRKDNHWLYDIFLPIVTAILELASLFEVALSKWVLVDIGFREGNIWRIVEGCILFFRQKIKHKIFPIPYLKLGQHSILSFCSKDPDQESWWKQVLDFFEVKEIWNNIKHTHYVPFDDLLVEHIRIGMSRRLTDPRRLIDANQNPILTPLRDEIKYIIGEHMNFNVTRRLELGEAIIVWHLATDLCHEAVHPTPIHLKHAKIISDYMLYLVVEHPQMLSSVENVEIFYKDACAAVRQLIASLVEKKDTTRPLHQVLEEIGNRIGNSGAYTSLLLDGRKIAHRLKEWSQLQTAEAYHVDCTWILLFEFWVDLLSHAAFKCKGKNHAERLRTGGELLTYVWVFLIHWFTRVP